MSSELEALKQSVDKVSAQLEQLSAWHEELKAARKHITAATALEEQTLSIVGRLNEKWRENTESILRLRETLENLSAHGLVLSTKFDLLYEHLSGIFDHPVCVLDRRTRRDRRLGEGLSNDTAE